MQLKTLAAIVSVAFTLGVQAAPNPFDRAAGVKGVLKRYNPHGEDLGKVTSHERRVGKQCKSKTKTTPSTPTPQQPEAIPTPQQPETTPTPQQPETTPDTIEPISSPAPVPTSNDNNNNNNTGNGSTSLDAVSQQWLDKHNEARALHGAAPLTWSSELATYAENYGKKCIWEHSHGPYGENLAAATGGLTPADSVNMWMDEVRDYDPEHPVYSHFTQVVWKSTTTLGCAIVKCGPHTIFPESNGDSYYGICEYDPPGNYIGQFGENVQK